MQAIPNSWVKKIQQVALRGTPDFLMCLSGLFVAIELKTDEGETSALQDYNLEQIASSGGIAIIMTPSNFEKCILFLETLGKESAKYGIKSTIYR